MNEKEKKAIEMIGLLSIGDFVTWFTTDGIVNMELSAKTVLNLVEKQQAEIEKKDKQIDLMADKLVKDTEWFYSEFDNYTKEDFKQYFEKKVEE